MVNKKFLRVVSSVGLGGGLLYVGYKFLLGPEELELMVNKPPAFHLYSCLLVLPIYISGGIGNYVLLKAVYKKNISFYDVLTLPFVINLWGYIMPFQGAYLYNAVYFKAKYAISVVNTTSIYILSLSISFILAGILGLIYSAYIHSNMYLIGVSIAALVNPLFIMLLLRVIKNPGPQNKVLSALFKNAKVTLDDSLQALNSRSLIAFLLSLNLINTLLFVIWSIWIIKGFRIELSFFQLVILSLLLKISLLIKITPGNIGINQFTSSGIVMLVGGSASAGFILSLYQTLIFIIMSFFVGSICSAVNMKFFLSKPT